MTMLLLAAIAALMLTGQATSADDGVVTLECQFNRDGRLRDCIILSEPPPGQGFGQAAIEAAARARLSRRTVEDAPRNGKVRFTTRFRLDDSGRPLT